MRRVLSTHGMFSHSIHSVATTVLGELPRPGHRTTFLGLAGKELATRKLLLIGQGSVLAFMVLAITVYNTAFAVGPLGAVTIKPGAPIEIRALLSESVVTSVSPLIGTAMELAIEDYGPIHGHLVSVQTLDEMCSGPRWARGGRGGRCRPAGRRRHRDPCAPVRRWRHRRSSVRQVLSMISPANTSPLLTSDLAGNAGPHHHEGYYRVTDNDLIEASVVAHFSYDELGLRTMVTIHDGDAYTSSIANAFAVEFTEHGGAVPIVARVAKGQTDMAAGSRPVRRRRARRRVHPALPHRRRRA